MSRLTACWQKQLVSVKTPAAVLVSLLVSCARWLMQIRVLIVVLLLMLLSGCASTEPAPQYLREPVPQVWTDTIAEPSLDGTYGAYMARCELFIKQCNDDRISVRRWSDEATEEVEE